MLVVYHDIIGECLEKERDKQQIANLIDSEDDFDMLKAIGMADSIAVNGFWEGRLASGADKMKATVMRMRDRQ